MMSLCCRVDASVTCTTRAAGLRLFPPAVTGTVRKLAHPVATKRHGTLPRGTQVFVPPYAIHHSTRVRFPRFMPAVCSLAMRCWHGKGQLWGCSHAHVLHLDRAKMSSACVTTCVNLARDAPDIRSMSPASRRQLLQPCRGGMLLAPLIAGMGGRCARVAARQVAEGALGGSVQAGCQWPQAAHPIFGRTSKLHRLPSCHGVLCLAIDRCVPVYT